MSGSLNFDLKFSQYISYSMWLIPTTDLSDLHTECIDKEDDYAERYCYLK